MDDTASYQEGWAREAARAAALHSADFFETPRTIRILIIIPLSQLIQGNDDEVYNKKQTGEG